MILVEQVNMARKNRIQASKDFSFKIISPYVMPSNNQLAFAFLPEYGSLNGAVIDLIYPPAFTMNLDVKEWAISKGCFYSFINIDSVLDYNPEYFKEVLDDWMRYKNND